MSARDDGDRAPILDALDGMLTAARELLEALERARDAYAAGYDAGVCASMEAHITFE